MAETSITTTPTQTTAQAIGAAINTSLGFPQASSKAVVLSADGETYISVITNTDGSTATRVLSASDLVNILIAQGVITDVTS